MRRPPLLLLLRWFPVELGAEEQVNSSGRHLQFPVEAAGAVAAAEAGVVVVVMASRVWFQLSRAVLSAGGRLTPSEKKKKKKKS